MQALCSIIAAFKKSQGKWFCFNSCARFVAMKSYTEVDIGIKNISWVQQHFWHESLNTHGQASYLYTQSPPSVQKDFHYLTNGEGGRGWNTGISCIKENSYTWIQRNTSQGRTAYLWWTKPDPAGLISSFTTSSAEFSWLFKGKSSLKLQLPHMSF